ncbi:MAG TPA: ABC transporter substrate-binding protein [Chloroflexota bacterium]|nr:ABC transporter substrate-binding protein [Chloroflexota bacterium]
MRVGQAVSLRAHLVLVTLFLVGLSLSGCHEETPWRGIIKIAIVAPYSGPLTADGASLLAGAWLATDDVNAAGGINGYRLDLIAADERLPSTPRDVAEDPAVVSIVGYRLSDAQTAEAVYRQAGLTWLATEPVDAAAGVYPLVATPSVVDRAVDRFLSSATPAEAGPPIDAGKACQVAGTRDSGGVARVGTLDVVCGGDPNVVEFALGRLSSGTTLLCVAAWCDAPEVARWAGGRAFDVVVPAAVPSGSSRWKTVAARLGSAGQVAEAAALGYDGVQLSAAAMRRAEPRDGLTRGAVSRAMVSTSYAGILGQYGPRGLISPVVEVRQREGGQSAPVLFRMEDGS